MTRWLIALLASMACAGDSVDLSKSFPAGSGSRFVFTMTNGPSADLVISVAGSSPRKVSIEYYFASAAGPIPTEMWQQFVLEHSGQGAAQLTAGYILAQELSRPEKLTPEYLKGFDGVVTSDFLFSDAKTLARFKIGEENVTSPAGSVLCSHYRQERNGQTTDYWISDEARPIGLVKLASKGSKPDHNYTVTLSALLKNVKPKIDPAQAVPLSPKGKSLLAAPGQK